MVTYCPNCDHPIGRFNKKSLPARILGLLEADGSMTVREIATRLAIAESSARKAIHRLSSEQLVRSERITGSVNGLPGPRLRWRAI